MSRNPTGTRRRLQREPDFTGNRLTTFRQVFLRHGLPGLVLSLGFMAVPGLPAIFMESVERAAAAPHRYAFWAAVICVALNIYAWRIDRKWDAPKLGWVVYLGVLSFWEEWVFRVALPQMMEQLGTSVWVAAALSAVAFGGAHYFTLRWKWQWCVGAMIGGLALSRQMEMQGDLLLITAFHWGATFLNTPRLPGQATQTPDNAA